MSGKRISDVEGTLETLPDEATMRALGFTDRREGVWYFCETIDLPWLTFNVDIDKDTLEYETNVLDEKFLQPCYYNSMMGREAVIDLIDAKVKRLNDAGVLIKHDHGRYGDER